MEILKKCPKCGSEEYTTERMYGGNGEIYYYDCCTKCGECFNCD